MRLLTAGSLVRVQLGEPIEKSVSFYLRTFLFCIMYRTDRQCFFFFIHPTLEDLFVIHIKLNAYLVTFTYLDPAYDLGNYHLFLFGWDEIKFFCPAFELFVHRLPRETRTETSLRTIRMFCAQMLLVLLASLFRSRANQALTRRLSHSQLTRQSSEKQNLTI